MNMKYYDIHVDSAGTKDGDGYSIKRLAKLCK